MKKSFLVITALAAALVGGLLFQPSPVSAAPYGDSPRWERGERPERDGTRFLARMTKTLDLSAEQQEKIKAIMDEHQAKVAPLRQNLDENRGKLRQATKADTFDPGKEPDPCRAHTRTAQTGGRQDGADDGTPRR